MARSIIQFLWFREIICNLVLLACSLIFYLIATVLISCLISGLVYGILLGEGKPVGFALSLVPLLSKSLRQLLTRHGAHTVEPVLPVVHRPAASAGASRFSLR